MADKHEQSQAHRKAHDLSEKAIERAAAGDIAGARKLAEEAKRLDPRIGEEMSREIDRDRRQSESYQEKQSR